MAENALTLPISPLANCNRDVEFTPNIDHDVEDKEIPTIVELSHLDAQSQQICPPFCGFIYMLFDGHTIMVAI